MNCVYCGGETRVANSRPQKRANRVWRRRVCLNCSTTFTSLEAIDLSGSITVKSLGQLEAFQRDKLFLSVYDSLKHRQTPTNDATGLTDTIIARLYPLMAGAVIEKTEIAHITISVLERFDSAAATHYSAFHHQ